MSNNVKYGDEFKKVGPNVEFQLMDMEFRMPKGYVDPDIPCPFCEANIPKREARVSKSADAGVNVSLS